MDTLYKIWRINLALPHDAKYREYPLEQVLSAITQYRDEVVSTNRQKLEDKCGYLNFIAADDERYEVRQA